MCSKNGPGGLRSLDSTKSDNHVIAKKHTKQRREGWRLSAQKKRDAEAGVFHDMELALPFPPTVVKSFDKVALLRLTACYIKLQSVLKSCCSSHGQLPPCYNGIVEDSLLAHFGRFGDVELGQLIGGGFLIILAPNGGIIYASDGASKYLQHDQLAILGTNLYAYVQKSDHCELDQLLSLQCSHILPPVNRTNSVTVRLQREDGQRDQVLRITGKQFLPSSEETCDHFFIGVAEPIGSHKRREHPLDYEFPYPQLTVYKTWDWAGTPDGKFWWDESVDKDFATWLPEDLVNANVWELFHPGDMQGVQKQIRNVFEQGHGWSSLYRILLKGGGWAWFICQASIVPVKKGVAGGGHKSDTYCIGRDYMISEVEEAGQVLATIQLGARQRPEKGGGEALSRCWDDLEGGCFEDDINAEDIEELLNFIGEEDGAWLTDADANI